MAKAGLIVAGIILMVLGAGATIFALPFVEQTACSGQGLFGSLAQLNEKTRQTCAENRMFLWGAVALGIVGIGLLVGGAAIPSKSKTQTQEVKKEEPKPDETSIEILKERYAKGEITKEEFENMKKDLENS